MRRRRCIIPCLGAFISLTAAAPALAAPVHVLDHGRTYVREDPFLAPAEPAAARARPAATPPVESAKTFESEVTRLSDAGSLDPDLAADALTTWREARSSLANLTGRRRTELGGAMANLDAIAARGRLIASRVPSLTEILARNREWWTTGKLLSGGARVSFSGSRVIYQYFRGEGIQFHPLANFGRVNGLLSGNFTTSAESMLEELLAFRIPRPGGGTAWEYSFDFGGGRPPWTSGLSQGSAVQAYARGSLASTRPDFADVARAGLRLFELPPPNGVRVKTAAGAHYLQYSYAPRLRILNGFVNSLNGIFDVARTLGDARALALYRLGEAQARVEVPRYDTGAWSWYSEKLESDLHYHGLLRDFIQGLCERSAVEIYCTTAARFTAYLTQPPKVSLVTRRLKVGKEQRLQLRVSKLSSVTVTGVRAGQVVYSFSGRLGYGARTLNIRPRAAGPIRFTLTARDLAGNRGAGSGTVLVP